MQTLEIDTPRWSKPLFQPSRYKGVHGGRAGGKSRLLASMLVEEHACDYNQASVCVRETQKSIDLSVKRLIEQTIEKYKVSHLFDVGRSAIKSTRGDGLIAFQGMQDHTADSIKSLEDFDRCWIEEAQSLSQRSLDLIRPTFRKDGSEIWASWNPYMETDPIDRLLRSETPPPDSIIVNTNYMDNPWITSVAKQEMEYDRDHDKDKYEHVWLGGYVRNSESRVFHNWRVEEVTPVNVPLYYGLDFGFSVDPTAFLRCWVDQDKREIYVDQEVYKVGIEIDDIPAYLDTIPGSRHYRIVADSARPDTISYLRNQGFNIVGAKKGKGSVEDGVEFLKSYTIIVHPRCKHFIDELTMYSYKVDKRTGIVMPDLEDKNNHHIDATRYALQDFVSSTTEVFIG